MAARQFLEYRFIPTRESSVLFEIILHQALKQTGGTTRDCRSCLQVHNILLMEGWSAFYRKFLRISDIRELWAATRILSRGSMSSSSSWYVCRFFSKLKSLFSYLFFSSNLSFISLTYLFTLFTSCFSPQIQHFWVA